MTNTALALLSCQAKSAQEAHHPRVALVAVQVGAVVCTTVVVCAFPTVLREHKVHVSNAHNQSLFQKVLSRHVVILSALKGDHAELRLLHTALGSPKEVTMVSCMGGWHASFCSVQLLHENLNFHLLSSIYMCIAIVSALAPMHTSLLVSCKTLSTEGALATACLSSPL